MMKSIKPSEVKGTVYAPPSKSMTIRALAAGLLSEGTTEIINPSFCDDSKRAMGIAESLGAKIEINKERNRIFVKGNSGIRESTLDNKLECGESGLCMRMFAPIACLSQREFILTGQGSIFSRPMKMLEDLTDLGASCKTENGFPPLVVKGPIRGGRITTNASLSSQFLTGLLFALPLCLDDSIIDVKALKSKPYIKMTISLLNAFGISITHNEDMDRFTIRCEHVYRPFIYKVEGDWSGAAFLLVAGALAGSVSIKGLDLNSPQADKDIVEVLKVAGAKITIDNDCVKAERNRLCAFRFDATHCPDLFPPLVALASACEGKSKIYGSMRLIHKESNRGDALSSEFAKLGIKVEQFPDRIEVTGGKAKGGIVKSHNDHRIAMACAIAGLRGVDETKIEDWECVSKSYPDFFSHLKILKGDI